MEGSGSGTLLRAARRKRREAEREPSMCKWCSHFGREWRASWREDLHMMVCVLKEEASNGDSQWSCRSSCNQVVSSVQRAPLLFSRPMKYLYVTRREEKEERKKRCSKKKSYQRSRQ